MGGAERVVDDAEHDAEDAPRTTALRLMARAGYGGSAFLRALIGVLALLLALHEPGAQPHASGAFGSVAKVPGGVLLLAVVAVGESALGAWLVVAGFLTSSSHALERWRQRLVYWGRAVFYGVVATTAARFALGAHEDSARSERAAGRQLLDVPGGAIVLTLIGGTVLVVGVGMVWVGASPRFRQTIHVPDHARRRRAVLASVRSATSSAGPRSRWWACSWRSPPSRRTRTAPRG